MIASSTTPQAQGRFDLTDCPAYVGTKLTDKLQASHDIILKEQKFKTVTMIKFCD